MKATFLIVSLFCFLNVTSLTTTRALAANDSTEEVLSSDEAEAYFGVVPTTIVEVYKPYEFPKGTKFDLLLKIRRMGDTEIETYDISVATDPNNEIIGLVYYDPTGTKYKTRNYPLENLQEKDGIVMLRVKVGYGFVSKTSNVVRMKLNRGTNRTSGVVTLSYLKNIFKDETYTNMNLNLTRSDAGKYEARLGDLNTPVIRGAFAEAGTLGVDNINTCTYETCGPKKK